MKKERWGNFKVDMAAAEGNKYAEGNNGGRPPLFDDPAILQQSVDSYFETAKKVTITGLAYHLGFESRQSFYDYEKREEFSYTIKRARLRVEQNYEEKLHDPACTGAIFALKNLEWADKSESKVTVTNLSSLETADLKKLEELLSKAHAG